MSAPSAIRAGSYALAILYEDAALLALDKPAGLAVQRGSGVAESLEDLLRPHAKPGKPFKLVHRLDRETSGVIVLAKNRSSAAALSNSFAGRAVDKRYLAIVCGDAPLAPEGVLAMELKKETRNGVDLMRAARAGEQGALAARTRYRLLASTEQAALIGLSPETGRMHQLRAHLSAAGRPIAGDGKYGGLFAIGKTPIPTLMLHALSLALPHPKGGMIRLEAAPPPAFVRTAAALGLDVAQALAAPKGG